MTSSFGFFERMRWMSALAGSAILTLIAVFVFAHGNVHVPSLSAGASSQAAPAARGSNAPLDPRIASLAARRPGARVEAIVQYRAGVSVRRAQRDAARTGGHVGATLRIINGLVVTMTARQASLLAGNPDVHSVSLNTEITTEGGPQLGSGRGHLASQLQTTYDQTLGVTSLWRGGSTGAGVGVAVIDTGVDGQLADFAGSSGRSRVIATAVTNPGAKTVFDTYGHGTDVAGIIAGNGNQRDASDPLNGKYVGVAPDANLIAIKASDDKGNATVLNVIYGLQFAIQHQRDYNIRVVNLSLDSATPQSYKTDPLDAAVEATWKHGIVVVAAAGNRGSADNAVQFAPGNDPYAITAGGVDENGTADASDDVIAGWSSRGVTQDGFQKPDVYAPGAHIVSVLAPDSYFAHACPNCIVDGQYIRTSGTSMATPMISGLIADVLSKHASLTPDQVKGALTSASARSNPALQEVNAVKVAQDANPQAANQGLTLSKLLGGAGSVNPAMGSWSMGSWSMGSWSMGSWSTAQGSLSAPFAMGSWSCESCGKSSGAPAGVNSSMGSWSMGSWSTIQDESGDQQ